MKRKCLVVGIVLLFVGTCVLSVIPARVVDVITYENTSNNLITSTFTFVGLIKDVTIHQSAGDGYNESRYFFILHYPEAYTIGGYSEYIGIFSEHFICARFCW